MGLMRGARLLRMPYLQVRWLGVLARHYAAAAFAVPTSTTFDAIRLLVMAAL